MSNADPDQAYDAGDKHTASFDSVECAWWPYRHGESAETRVRAWLAPRLRTKPNSLPLVRDTHGRPMLVGTHSATDVNWSHSEDWLVAACARDVRIGIDLEVCRQRPSAVDIAQRFFHPDEAAALVALGHDPVRQQHAFVRLWCAKEAVLKAHGHGLSFGLERVCFALDDDVTAPRLISCDPRLGMQDDWRLWAWSPVPGYLATLAVWHR